MKKVLFLGLILLAAVSCKKNNTTTNPAQTDPRDAIVGDYTLTINGSVGISCDYSAVSSYLPDSIPFDNKVFDLKIEKDPSDANQVILSGLYNTTALVVGNNMVLTKGMSGTMNIKVSDVMESVPDILSGLTIPVQYTISHNKATINGNTITWVSDVEGSASVNVYISTINFEGDGYLKNVAVKK